MNNNIEKFKNIHIIVNMVRGLQFGIEENLRIMGYGNDSHIEGPLRKILDK